MESEKADPKIEAVVRLAKTDASNWLGLIAMEQGNHRAAIDYFAKRVLEASPGSAWTHGAKYNLARVYEAAGQPDKAIELYESDVRSPTYRGNLLRARWLGSKTSRRPVNVSTTPAMFRWQVMLPVLARTRPSAAVPTSRVCRVP